MTNFSSPRFPPGWSRKTAGAVRVSGLRHSAVHGIMTRYALIVTQPAFVAHEAEQPINPADVYAVRLTEMTPGSEIERVLPPGFLRQAQHMKWIALNVLPVGLLHRLPVEVRGDIVQLISEEGDVFGWQLWRRRYTLSDEGIRLGQGLRTLDTFDATMLRMLLGIMTSPTLVTG